MDQNKIAICAACKTRFRAIASDRWVDKHVVFMQRGYYCSNHTSRRKGPSDVSIWKLQSRFFSEDGRSACPMSPRLVSGFCASLFVENAGLWAAFESEGPAFTERKGSGAQEDDAGRGPAPGSCLRGPLSGVWVAGHASWKGFKNYYLEFISVNRLTSLYHFLSSKKKKSYLYEQFCFIMSFFYSQIVCVFHKLIDRIGDELNFHVVFV